MISPTLQRGLYGALLQCYIAELSKLSQDTILTTSELNNNIILTFGNSQFEVYITVSTVVLCLDHRQSCDFLSQLRKLKKLM